MELARNSDMQAKLRDELSQVHSATPSLDTLNSLSYLDHVVREALRLRAVVAFVLRVATADDVIPLSNPVKLQNGQTVDRISFVDLVLLALHTATNSMSSGSRRTTLSSFQSRS